VADISLRWCPGSISPPHVVNWSISCATDTVHQIQNHAHARCFCPPQSVQRGSLLQAPAGAHARHVTNRFCGADLIAPTSRKMHNHTNTGLHGVQQACTDLEIVRHVATVCTSCKHRRALTSGDGNVDINIGGCERKLKQHAPRRPLAHRTAITRG
jgi:hypothetical protein